MEIDIHALMTFAIFIKIDLWPPAAPRAAVYSYIFLYTHSVT